MNTLDVFGSEDEDDIGEEAVVNKPTRAPIMNFRPDLLKSKPQHLGPNLDTNEGVTTYSYGLGNGNNISRNWKSEGRPGPRPINNDFSTKPGGF